MKERPYYKRYTEDFIHGCRGLTLEERGAYSTIVDWIYDKGAPLRDDPRWWASECMVSVRKWNSIRASLIAKGKIYVTEDGRLMNSRAAKEIAASNDLSTEQSTKGKKGRQMQLALTVSRQKNALKTLRKSSENEHESNNINDVPRANARETRRPENIRPITTSSEVADDGEGSFANAQGGVNWWFEPTDTTLEDLRAIAPGWDRQHLVAMYREHSRRRDKPNYPQAAFLGWAKAFTKGGKPS